MCLGVHWSDGPASVDDGVWQANVEGGEEQGAGRICAGMRSPFVRVRTRKDTTSVETRHVGARNHIITSCVVQYLEAVRKAGTREPRIQIVVLGTQLGRKTEHFRGAELRDEFTETFIARGELLITLQRPFAAMAGVICRIPPTIRKDVVRVSKWEEFVVYVLVNWSVLKRPVQTSIHEDVAEVALRTTPNEEADRVERIYCMSMNYT